MKSSWLRPVSSANRCVYICIYIYIWVFPKIEVSQIDGENNGKPYEQMDDLGVPLFLETPI